MMNLVAKTTVPKDNLKEFLELAGPLVEASRKDKGNYAYQVSQDQENPEVVAFVESWEDQASLDLHEKMPHFIETMPKLLALTTSEMVVDKYDVLI